jgi:hypothetical protein
MWTLVLNDASDVTYFYLHGSPFGNARRTCHAF